jgi:hypothetical protein
VERFLQLKAISERRIAMKVTKTISNEKLALMCGTAKETEPGHDANEGRIGYHLLNGAAGYANYAQ